MNITPHPVRLVPVHGPSSRCPAPWPVRAIDAVGPCPAPAPGGPPRTASGPSCRPRVACPRIPQRRGALGVQVDLTLVDGGRRVGGGGTTGPQSARFAADVVQVVADVADQRDTGDPAVAGYDDRGVQAVPADGFLLKYVGQPSHFQTMPETTARVLVLPAAMLKPLLGGRIITGPADSAEMRLLMAHANMIYATMPDLAPGRRPGRPQHPDRAGQGSGQALLRRRGTSASPPHSASANRPAMISAWAATRRVMPSAYSPPWPRSTAASDR
jgi:hypothetical protein